ncbi:DUF4181 domain-containing protein [Paenibacillus cisolokensis]|uniref:DUF4181 domain-containing protein n=1 Tax=Paenibacillus cisolokensis TaxID=1658519 RepID=UPI003D2B735D
MIILYSLFSLAAVILQSILTKVHVYYDAEDMKDSHVYRRFVGVSMLLILPGITAIWFLDLSEPQPLLALLLAVPYFYRGYMEFTHIKESNRHKVSFILAFYFLGVTIVLELLRLSM